MSSSFKSAFSPISRRILLLEDIPDAAADLSQRLQQLESVVLRRAAGGPVTSEIVNLEPDVILIYIGTPRTNAYRLTTELRKKLCSRALIVAVSRSRQEIERGWPKGDFDYRVVWPNDERILLSLIGERTEIKDVGTIQPASARMTGHGRLLLVEDNLLLADATAEFIRLSGLDVLIAENGEDALQAVRNFRPEIVLCDLGLPDMSGMDLLRTLRSNSEAKDAVLAVLTAMDNVDLRLIECETDVQVDFFFSKPLTEEQLRRLLNELSSKRQAARSPAPADKRA
jgi:DNA-binding response OmpR family regulator